MNCGHSDEDANLCVDAETDAVSGHMSGGRADWYGIQLAVAEGLGSKGSLVEVWVGRRSYNRCRCLCSEWFGCSGLS